MCDGHAFSYDENKGFDISSMLITNEFVSKIVKHRKYDSVIAEYYYKLAQETKSNKEFWKYLNKADRIKACNQYWVLNSYEQSKIRDFLKTYLCRDPFCANCKKVRQAQRMNNYLDLFQKYDTDLYFFTITVPNCQGSQLREQINRLFAMYNKLIKCLDGSYKFFEVLGLNEVFGEFLGAVRSLEVTYKKEGRFRFHPHIHAAIALKKYDMSKKYIKNRFSYSLDKMEVDSTKDEDGNFLNPELVNTDGKQAVRQIKTLFNREEVKLQKLMYLFYDEVIKKEQAKVKGQKYNDSVAKKVTGKYLDNMKSDQCLSLSIEKFKPGQYKEMFKYMVKDNFGDIYSDEVEEKMMDYDTFKILARELWNLKQIQGCGVFKNVTDDNDFELEGKVDKIYSMFIYSLKQKELPVMIEEAPEDVLHNIQNGRYIYISRKKIFSYLKKSLLEEKFTVEDFEPKDDKSLIDYTFMDSIVNDIIAHDEKRSKQIRVELEENYGFLSNTRYTVI